MKGLFIPEITAEMFRNGCLEGIEALMAEGEIYDIEYEPQWIPCSERLPEEYREYLVCYTSDDAVGLLWLDDTRESKAIVKKYNILAWMPLPEPYRKDGD